MNAEHKQLRARIHGRVQGVSFRHYTVQEAQQLGITGWVRNEPDETVQVVAEGTQAQLDALLEFLHIGPPNAQVTQVDVSFDAATGGFAHFETIYHAR